MPTDEEMWRLAFPDEPLPVDELSQRRRDAQYDWPTREEMRELWADLFPPRADAAILQFPFRQKPEETTDDAS